MSINKIFTLMIFLLLSSCARFSIFNELREVQPGIQESKLVEDVNIHDSFGITVDDERYSVHYTYIKTSVRETSNTSTSQTGNVEVRTTTNTTTIGKAGYYFVCKNDKLMAQGFIYQLKQHNDDLIRRIGKQISLSTTEPRSYE